MNLETKVPPPVVFLILAFAMAALARFSPHAPFDPSVRIPLAFAIIALGLMIGLLAFLHFQTAKTTLDPVKIDAASALVTEGVYRFSRNPMYLGLTIMLVGWAIFLAAPWTAIGPAVFIAYITQYQIEPEERALTKKFGGAYRQYQLQTRRWI